MFVIPEGIPSADIFAWSKQSLARISPFARPYRIGINPLREIIEIREISVGSSALTFR